MNELETHAPESGSDDAEADGGRLGRHASAVGGMILGSRILGFVRDWCLAIFFARARWVSDAFLTALALPNLFRGLLGEGALTSSFLPVFVKEKENAGLAGASRLAGQVFGLLAAATGGLAAAGILVLLAAGWLFGHDPALGLALRLSAGIFPYMPLICGTALLGAMLQSLHRFAFPAGLSILFNLFFFAGFAWIYWGQCGGDLSRLADAPEKAAWTLVAAVVASGVAQIALAWLRLRTLGVRAAPSLRRDHPGVAQTLKAFAPAALGAAVVQANVFVDMIIAYALSLRAPGAKTYLYLGNQLMHFPLALCATAVASTAFPFFARHVARGEHDALAERLGQTVRMVWIVAVPAGIGLAVLADPIARMLYQGASMAFDHVAVYRTALATTFYGLGLPFFGVQMLLVKWFYARGDYRTPVRVAIRMVGLNVVLNLGFIFLPDFLRLWSPTFSATGFIQAADIPLWRGDYATAYGVRPGEFPFGERLGESGLALATTVTAVVHVVWLGWAARARFFGEAGGSAARDAWRRAARETFSTGWRVAVAGALMGVLVHWFARSIPYEPELPARVARALIPMGLGVVAYYGLGLIVPVKEIDAWNRRVFARRPRDNGPDDGAEGSA